MQGVELIKYIADLDGELAEKVAEAIGMTAEQVERVYEDIDAKRRVAHYLHEAPRLVTD